MKNIYHIFFLFDLFKFTISSEGSHLWSYEPKEDNSEFPIERVYKFYSWEDLAFGYCGLDKNNIEINVEKRGNFIYWMTLINKNYNYFKQFYPEIDENYFKMITKNNY
jgi:hypothetical protein